MCVANLEGEILKNQKANKVIGCKNLNTDTSYTIEISLIDPRSYLQREFTHPSLSLIISHICAKGIQYFNQEVELLWLRGHFHH